MCAADTSANKSQFPFFFQPKTPDRFICLSLTQLPMAISKKLDLQG